MCTGTDVEIDAHTAVIEQLEAIAQLLSVSLEGISQSSVSLMRISQSSVSLMGILQAPSGSRTKGSSYQIHNPPLYCATCTPPCACADLPPPPPPPPQPPPPTPTPRWLRTRWCS